MRLHIFINFKIVFISWNMIPKYKNFYLDGHLHVYNS